MNLPPVFLGVGIVDGFHSAVEHNLATGDVFLEVACCYLVEAHFFHGSGVGEGSSVGVAVGTGVTVGSTRGI